MVNHKPHPLGIPLDSAFRHEAVIRKAGRRLDARLGRKRGYTDEQAAAVREAAKDGRSIRESAKASGLSRSTVNRILMDGGL